MPSATPIVPAASWNVIPDARSPAVHANGVTWMPNTITTTANVTSTTSTVETRSTMPYRFEK